MIVMSIVEPVDGEDCLRLVNDVFNFFKWYLILPDHIGHSWGTSSAQVSPSLGPWSPLVSRNQQCTAQHEGLTRSYYHKVSYHKVASWMLMMMMMMMINHEKWCILQFSSHRTWAWNIPQGWFFLHVPISRGMFDCHAADGAVESPAVDQKPSAFPKVFMVVQSCHELFEFEQQGFCMVLSHGLLFQVIPGRNNQDKSTADWGGLSTTWNAGVKQWVEFLNGNVSRGDVRGNHHLLLHDQVIIGLRQNLSAYTFWNYMGIRRDVV